MSKPPLFTTIAKFTYTSEALIIKGRLESDGIEVFLADNLTIDTDPLISNAIGGVKLKVLTEDVEKAREILNSISQYSLDDEGEKIECPNCKSEKVDYFSNIKGTKSFLSFLVSFVFYVLPIYSKREYRCEECKTRFKVT